MYSLLFLFSSSETFWGLEFIREWHICVVKKWHIDVILLTVSSDVYKPLSKEKTCSAFAIKIIIFWLVVLTTLHIALHTIFTKVGTVLIFLVYISMASESQSAAMAVCKWYFKCLVKSLLCRYTKLHLPSMVDCVEIKIPQGSQSNHISHLQILDVSFPENMKGLLHTGGGWMARHTIRCDVA